ncbi:coronatine-insensitive protein 1-like isoform X2 [Durio zibethinus]|uniref:Coronatine-insensitive protein 1-like isoform X2 n=1 Tax=Durio zibethinus TaxID=66656 RepID=A0A6P6AJP6_DURZI|nr:coronatine-insensitive protein 1-like isoform X2 [Durio zibethinus]
MEENDNKLSKPMTSQTGMSDVVLGCVMLYIDDPKDRDAVSLVCRRWYELDALTRKHITIALCYTTSPDRLRRRFQHLESLKLKGKPRAAMFNLIPEDWGGYVTPWVNEIAENFNCLKSVHFRRMIVKDSDLAVLARSRGKVLQVLKLDKCSGFSTDGLLHVGRLCRQLKTLFLEESSIIEKDGQWLHEIALNNSVLETLNFYMTDLVKTRNVIGDRGLEVLARSCKRLKRLRIERGADEQEMEDEEGVVSQRGLMALAQGCLELEYLAVYVSDITNASLEHIGTHSKNLCDFRLVLLDREERITDLPLDYGVRALLRGCEKLRRFALYLRPGGLTDVGLGYIGQYSPKVRWMLLGYVGETDAGLLEFSKGCPSLQKLEMRGCCFSEHALAVSVTQLTSLRYLWVQGYRSTRSGHDLLAMARPFWNIEIIPARQTVMTDQAGEAVMVEHPAHILAYYSLAGPRKDFPDTVIPLDHLLLE